jgi:hypothetical protein
MRVPIEFAKTSYKSKSVPVSAQRLLNFYPELQPDGSKSRVVLFGTPGLSLFATAGSGPIRGMIPMGSLLYVVSSTSLYSVNSTGTATLIGTINGSSNVSMATNGTDLIICHGSTSSDKAYRYTVAGGLAAIGDADFRYCDTVDFLDQFFIFNANDGTGQFFISDVGSGSSYDASQFATAEAKPDVLRAVKTLNRELWLFGAETTEIWGNQGGAFPFSRQHVIQIGCISRFSPAVIMDGVCWLGDDGIVYFGAGYSARRISTHAIEAEFATYTTLEDAVAYAYKDEGHYFYVLSFPTQGKTWCVDIPLALSDSGIGWHERSYFNNGSHTRHRSNCYARAFSKNLVGDYSNGKIYQLKNDTYTDDSDTIQRIAVAPTLHANGQMFFIGRFEIEFEAGVGLASGQGSNPEAMLEWSADGGQSFDSDLSAAIGNASIGGIGAYQTQAVWMCLGAYLQFTPRLIVSDPVKWVVMKANADIEISET